MTNNVNKPNTILRDFYNISVDVNHLGNPQTFESQDIQPVNLNVNIDDDTRSENYNISGTDTASSYNLKNHFNSCKNNRVIGCFKARKYIFPRQDVKHPGYYDGTHSDIEKLEYFMGTSCGLLNTSQYEFYCKLAGRDVKHKEISKLGIPNTIYEIRHEKKKYAISHPSEKKKETRKVLMTTIGNIQEEQEKLEKLKLEYLNDKTKVFDMIEKGLEAQRYISKNCSKKFEKFKRQALGNINDLQESKLTYFLKKLFAY